VDRAVPRQCAACIFCGQTDSPQHKEDVLPKWIARPWPDSYIQVKAIKTGRKFVARGHLGIVARGPCQRCNNTWMSQLENVAKPLLLPMMQGEQTELTPDSQRLLARWLTKTCMMIDLASTPHESRFFRPRDHKRFFANQDIPPNTSVYIGSYDAPGVGVKTRDYSLTFDIPGRSDGIGQISAFCETLALGRAVFQFFSWRRPEGYWGPLPFQPPAFWGRVITTTWPVGNTAFWPLKLGLNDNELELFAKRWTNRPASTRPLGAANLSAERTDER
jgi:hypothetical protein